MSDSRYFIMLSDPPWAGPIAHLANGPEVETNNGVSLGEVSGQFDIQLRVDAKAENPLSFPPLDLHGPSKRLLLSDRFVRLLESLGVDNVEYLDARVTFVPDGSDPAYRVANFLGVVQGLDRNRSDLDMDEDGFIFGMNAIVFDDSKIGVHKIFRLAEDVMFLIVHEDIKLAAEKAGLTGIRFVADEDWQPGMI